MWAWTIMDYRPANFLGHKLLFITAHPDDESYLCSGMMVKNHEGGGVNILICATDGEVGTAHLEKPVSPDQLKKIRRAELARVSKFLKVKKLYPLELPDGKVEAHKEVLFYKSLKIAKHEGPDYIFSFARDGITGHHDHVATWSVATKIAKLLKLPYYGFALPPRCCRYAKKWLLKRRYASHYHDGLNLARANVRVPIEKAVKLKALSYHRSQLDADDPFAVFPEYYIEETLAADYFVE